MTTLSEPAFTKGQIVRGKWNGHAYQIERLLGGGANGKVYLVRKDQQQFAMKIGFDTVDHQSEVNALQLLSRSSEAFKHYLVDADDLTLDKDHPFVVIRYVRGVTLKQYIREHGTDWLPVIGCNLLKKLCQLHAHQLAFCDLKAENMLISGYGDVDLVDFGGVSAFGRSAKQFTELFDRGFWSAGSRIAEASYDLFSFAVLMIDAAYPFDSLSKFRNYLPINRTVDELKVLIEANSLLRHYQPVLLKALSGQFASSVEALEEWRKLSVQLRQPQAALKQPVKANWLKVCFVASLGLFAFALYMAWPL